LGAAAFLAVALPGIELDDTLLGVTRWGEQEPYRAAEVRLREGDAPGALQLYMEANQEIADTRYGLAAALLQAGDAGRALSLLREDEPEDRFEPDILRGEAARLSGDLDAARALFNTRVVQVAGEDAVDWAWDHLRPPPTGRIEVGSGLDLGFVRGFHGPEHDSSGRTFRWTGPDAAVRGLSGNAQLSVRVSGWRPGGTPSARVTLAGGGAPVDVQTLPNSDEWDTILVNAEGTVDLATNAFVPGGYDPRLLGIRIMTIGANGAAAHTQNEPNP
jgi:hypothetical protein